MDPTGDQAQPGSNSMFEPLRPDTYQTFKTSIENIVETFPNRDKYQLYDLVGHPIRRLSAAFTDGQHSDITFVVSEGNNGPESFQAHKFILAINSSVFHAMFFGSLPELGSQVIINDIDPEAFRITLQYSYTGLFPKIMPLTTAANVIYCARKYDIRELELLAVTHCIENILNPATATQLLELSLFLELQELEYRTWVIIENLTEAVVAHDSFTCLQAATLEKILRNTNLNISETFLFQGVLRWANVQCERNNLEPNGENLRRVIGGNLRFLRLCGMTPEEFANGPGKSGILTDAEIGQILLFICSSTKESSLAKPLPCYPYKRERTSAKACTCTQVGCSFCSKSISKLGARKIPIRGLWSFQMPPPSYCSCRSQGECLSNPDPILISARRSFSSTGTAKARGFSAADHFLL